MIESPHNLGRDVRRDHWRRRPAVFVFGVLVGWWLSSWLATASEGDFRRATLAHYFKTLSSWEGGSDGLDLTDPASWRDCRLERSDWEERRRHGIEMFGLCSMEVGRRTLHYELALDSYANFVWSNNNIEELLEASPAP